MGGRHSPAFFRAFFRRRRRLAIDLVSGRSGGLSLGCDHEFFCGLGDFHDLYGRCFAAQSVDASQALLQSAYEKSEIVGKSPLAPDVEKAEVIAPIAVASLDQETGAAGPSTTETLTPPPSEEAPAQTLQEVEALDDAIDEPLAFEGESDEAVVQRLIDSIENTKTLTGDFTQIAPSGAISEGKLYLKRPGLLRFEYLPPTPLLIVANGGMVYVRDDALETTDSYPVGKTPLKFLLSKKLDLDDAEVIAVDRGINSVAVTLASKKDETEGELTIIVNATDHDIDPLDRSRPAKRHHCGYAQKCADRREAFQPAFPDPGCGRKFPKKLAMLQISQ